MKINYFILFVFIICFLLNSCKKPSPQLPSNKGITTDNSSVNLQNINKVLAAKEDSALEVFVSKKHKTFKKNEIGFWYKIDKSGNGTEIKDSETCRFKYKLELLNGKVIQEDEKQITIRKRQVIIGLEEAIKILKRGDKATLIIPWYLAYGMTGNEPLVPPYTSLIYEINILN